MNRILFSASALALTAGAAIAQNPVLTASELGGHHIKADGVSLPAAVCWYNGDLDFRDGLTSERNTAVLDSWTFDDVQWAGGTVTGFHGHWMLSGAPVIVAADIIVYSGMSEGNFGTQIASVNDVAVTLTPTGNLPFGLPENKAVASLGGSSFNLAAGTYHVGLRLVGSGGGQAFTSTTSGTNAVGTPPGNNGMSFLQSNYFGYPSPTNWQNLIGVGNWDVSFGLDCGSGGGYTVAVTGTCPGTVRLAWSGANPNRQQGILFARNTGNYTINSGTCTGTQLGLGTNQLQLYNTIGTGSGSGAVNAQAGQGACRGYVQLIQTNNCRTSNVAQVP